MIGAPSPREYLAAAGSFALRAARAARYGVIGLVLGLAGTAAWVLSTARIYRSEAVVVYDKGVQASSLGGDGESPRQMASRLNDMVMSRPRIEGLIKDMRLYQSIEEKRGLVEAIDEMRKRLNVTAREGYTFRVWYDGQTRELAKDVLDRMLASVVAEDRARRKREVEEAKRFLDAEREHADADLKTKESALASFLTAHPQLAGEVGGAASAGGLIRAADRDRMGVSGTEIASLEMQAAQLEESIAAASRRPGRALEQVDPALASALMRSETELHAAERELADKQTTLTNEHPDVRHAIKRYELAQIAQRHAAAAVANWKPSAVPTEAGGATEPVSGGDRVAAMRRALVAVKGQISTLRGRASVKTELPKSTSSVVAIDTDWTRLNREVAEARERQSHIEGKQFQAQLAATLAGEGQGGQFVVVDPPFKPIRPVAGGHFKVALAGGAASALFGLVIIVLIAVFDDRLYGPGDVQSLLRDDGIVVVIPKLSQPKLTARDSG